jgi:N-methylhydantoinase A
VRQKFVRSVSARYVGQSSDLSVVLAEGGIGTLFAAEHRRTYGYAAPETEPVELVGISVVGRGLADSPPAPGRLALDGHALPPGGTRKAFFGSWVEARVLGRADLATPRAGPAIVEEYDATCLVPPGWNACLDAAGNIVLDKAS